MGDMNLILTNTLFCHNRCNRYTWISPDNNTRNQIDYIVVNKQWTSSRVSILGAKSRPGADCYTDHILIDTENRFQVDLLCEAITEETIPNELWTSMEDSYKDSAK